MKHRVENKKNNNSKIQYSIESKVHWQKFANGGPPVIKRADVENLFREKRERGGSPPFESRSSNGWRKTVGTGLWGFVFGSISLLASSSSSSIGGEWTISRITRNSFHLVH